MKEKLRRKSKIRHKENKDRLPDFTVRRTASCIA